MSVADGVPVAELLPLVDEEVALFEELLLEGMVTPIWERAWLMAEANPPTCPAAPDLLPSPSPSPPAPEG